MFIANIYFLPAVLLLFIRGVAAAEDSTEFTLNVFTDIAPILALFGEQFAQQYLSQSFTWLDHLIFACVPLGIITALSGAIRTRGPRLARSFIGRARENLATVEIGLMSSVSHEVCEMFNGSGIIRTMGRSTLAQIMIFPDEYDAAQSGASDDSSCGIHTLQTALQSKKKGGPLMVCSEYQGKTYQRLRRLLNPKNLALKYPYHQMQEKFDFKCPPNLQLNLSTGHSSRSRKTAELWSASITSVVLQLSLLAIAAVVAYAVGFENNPYAFPCYVIGSTLLCAGMAICSAAIESSTDELVWTPRRKKYRAKIEEKLQTNRNPYIMWIQQPQSVGDQTFDAYAILGGSKPYVLTSSRSKDLWTAETSQKESGNTKQSRRGWWEAVTVMGVLLGSLGFIIQFIGLRGLPWPVAVSQLMAILIMALIRALIRRGVGVIPLACVALPGHELDFLATRIVFYPNFREFKDGNPSNGGLRDNTLKEVCRWEVMTPNKDRRLTTWTENQGRETGTGQDSRKQEPQTGSSQQLVKVRERLGDLCKWKTTVSETAVALAQLIEHFMTIFFEKKVGRRRVVEEEVDKIMWAIKSSALCENGNDKIEETMVVIERKNGKWVAELGKIEAILSLWMASIKARRLDMEENCDATDNRLDTRIGDWRRSSSAKVKFERIVGDGQLHSRGDSFMRDISWWVGNDVVSRYEKDGWPDHLVRKEPSDFTIGFDTPTSGHQRPPHANTERLSQASTATIPSIMAQHLFTSFIWAISEHLPQNSLHQGEGNSRDFVQVDSATSFNPGNLSSQWSKPNLSHSLLASIAKEGESSGLGTATDILLCVIPALRFRDLLPNEAIFGLMPSVPEGIQQYGWEKMTNQYSEMLRLCSSHDGEHFATAALVETVEFILLALPSYDLMDTIKYLLREITTRFPETFRQLALGYHLQNRGDKLCEIFRRCGFHHTILKTMLLDQDAVGEQELATFRNACGWSKTHHMIIERSVEIREWLLGDNLVKPDVLGWTPLHHIAAIATQEPSMLREYFLRAVRDGKVFSCLDKSQRSPFHIAASSGHAKFLEECIDWADANPLEAALLKGGLDGKTPLHLAVEGQHLDCVELLLQHSASGQGDTWGRTPMHLAALGWSYAIGKKLLAHFPEPLQVDKLGSTPLTYLLRNEKDKTVDQGRTDFAKELMATWTMAKTDDGSGNSLLHYAAAFSDEDEIENLVKELGNVNISNRKGQTPLHLAALEGRTVAARKLVSLGAQAESVDDRGWSALHYAANCRDAETGLVSFILKTKKDAINMTEESEKTPLHMAAAAGNASAAMLLVSEGAELSARDQGKDTPLFLALRNNRKVTIVGLLSCDGAVDTFNQTGQDGFEHIDVAIRRCNTECLEIVLLHTATTLLMRIYGLMAMIINGRTWKPADADLFDLVFKSIPERHLSILDLNELIHMFPGTRNGQLLHQALDSRRRDLKALREDPWALHFFAQHGDTSTLAKLLVAGADASRLDKDNWLPSDIADRYGHATAGDLLREHLAKDGGEPFNKPSYRVPAIIRDVYHEFNLTQSSYYNSLGRKQIGILGRFRNTGLTCAVFRTQECIPPNLSEYSFMVPAASRTNTCAFFIGFCNAGLPYDKLPGTYPGSWSYEHRLMEGTFTAWALGEKEAQSHTISVGDALGYLVCGLDMLTGEGYVTLDGERLDSGTVFDKHKFLHGKIYPCVAFSPRSYGNELEVDVTLPALEEGRLVIE